MRAICAYIITYQWASCAALFWMFYEFTRFYEAKTKRVRRLLSRSPNSSRFAIPPTAKSQVRQLSPLSPYETSPCFFWDPIKRSLRGADTNAFMSCTYPHPERHIPSVWAKYCKTFLATRARFILRCKITQKKWHTQICMSFFENLFNFYWFMSPHFYAVGEVRPGSV